VTCSEFLKELTDYLDNAIDARTRKDDCYVVCNTTKKTIEIYRDSRLYELPDDLRAKLRSAIVARCKSQPPES
jgi:hypothetical protein